MIEIILILIVVCAIAVYFNKSYEHMSNLSEYIDTSVNNSLNEMQHYNVCQIQQPQLGKNRPYVNWQKIHNYGSLPY